MSRVLCWAFEARSIQDYLFETGRLADAVGASVLVDRLTGDLGDTLHADDLLSQVMLACDLGEALRFSRRGGGAFIAFAEASDIQRLRSLWHASLAINAPGLRWSDGVASDPNPALAAQLALRQAQQAGQFDTARLPELTPAQLRVPRTGAGAVEANVRIGAKGLEPIDPATRARRRHRNAGQTRLTRRFLDDTSYRWPTSMEAESSDTGGGPNFPFLPGNADVAFLHADGNGLGVLLRRLSASASGDDYITRYAQFSQAIALATRTAAHRATEAVLVPACGEDRTMPARPLVLGGDDLLAIVRADLAIPFAKAFLLAFESASAEALQPLAHELQLQPGQGLTAACGLLIAKANFPFAAAAQLAGELCDRAKRSIKLEAQDARRAMPLSAISFERAKAALVDVDPVLVGQGLSLGMPTYVLASEQERPSDAAAALPRLDSLWRLAEALRDAPQGPARRLVADLHSDHAAARQRWKRMREIQGPQRWSSVQAALSELGVEPTAELPFDCHGASPWTDALLLRDLLQIVADARLSSVPEVLR